jgi:hypothetical protein
MNLFHKISCKFFNILFFVVFLFISCIKNTQSRLADYKTLKEDQTTQLNFVGHWMNEGDRGKLVR